MPLSAMQTPRLVEERMVPSLEGNEAWVRVYHMGRRQVAGAASEILEALMGALKLGTVSE